MIVIGSVYGGRDRPGDFAWMIERPEYADALFVFNDNQEQFEAHARDPADPLGCSPGGGNAVIRPYRCTDPPRAAGIPTGAGGRGYRVLDERVRAVIDRAIAAIARAAAAGGYRRIIYSASADGTTLGTGIFEVGADVKSYIVARLRSLADASHAPRDDAGPS